MHSHSGWKYFKINHSLNCHGKCLIYQYILTGEITNQFPSRWSNNKDNARKFDRSKSCMQEHSHKHFQTDGPKGFLNNSSVIFIEKTD